MRLRLAAFLVCLLSAGMLYAQGDKILVSGSGNPRVMIIDKATKQVEWSYQLERGDECNCVDMTPAGEILFAYKNGAKLVTKDQKVIWDYKNPAGTELQSASVLPDGGYLLAICGTSARFIELDNAGKVRHETTIDLGIENPHGQFRQVTKLRNGNYLVPVMGAGKVMELSKAGKVVHEFPVEGNLFSATELQDGSWMVACGDAHAYVNINSKTGQVLNKVGEKDIPGIQFLFVAQVIPLGNESYMICNWSGHNKDKSIQPPQLIEVDKDGKAVWTLDNKELGMISAGYYMKAK